MSLTLDPQNRFTAALKLSLVLALSCLTALVHAQQQRPEREETRPDEMAELAARSLTVSPEYPEPRELTQIRLEIQNKASARAQFAEISFFVNGQPLATRSITIREQAIQTVTVPWTPDSIGLHSISAVIDPRRLLTERDRTDNTAVIEIVVAGRPAQTADLAVTNLQTSSGLDRATTLRVTVRNYGSVQASAPLLVWHGDARRVLLVGPVAPGSSLSVEIPWGSDRKDPISAEINPRFRSRERRAGNNVFLLPARSSVDLRVEGLSLHTATLQPEQRRNVSVTFRIVNDGRRSITQKFRTRIEPEPFFVTTNGLAAGGIAYVSHTIRNAPAQFVVTVVVDVDRNITESDENNNTVTISFKNAAPDIDRWVSIGPQRVTGSTAHGYGWNDATGRLSAIAIHPTSPQTMYVGAQGAGVWKTTNGGTDWQTVADAATVRVAALALDPANASRVFLVTPNEGVFRSEDSGTSWIQISKTDLNAVVHGNVLLINPANSNDMVVLSEGGVYRSTDGGVSWKLKLNGRATGLIRRPTNSNILYAALYHETDANIAGVYQSFDAGETWVSKRGCPGAALPANDANTVIRLAVSGGQLFASYRLGEPLTWKLFRTTNLSCSIGGAPDVSWEAGFSTSGDNAAVLWSGMWADPTNPRNVYLGGTNFWRSTNNGTSFTVTSSLGPPNNSAHVDHHNVVSDPLSPNVIYSLNDGGIFQSTDRGATSTWKLFGGGIANIEFYDFTSGPTRPDLVIGGTQDNGTMKSLDGSTIWTMIRGGDGASVDIHSTNPDEMYAMFQYAESIARSTNGGGSFNPSAGGLPTGAQCFNLQFQIHSRFPNRLLACCMGLWQTTDSGTTWSTIFTPPTGSAVVRSTIDAPADVYYVGSSGGIISRGPAGTSWATIFTHPFRLSVTDLELDLDNSAVLYASFGGGNTRRIYRLVSSTVNPTTFTATDITSDLPIGRSVRALAVDRNNPFTIYAATDKGVYRGRSVDGGTTWFWVPYVNGMPPADVRDLEVHPGTGLMRAVTMGRSAYEVNTDHPMGSVLSVQGRIKFLRVHDVGTGFGPPTDFIDGEVIVKFDSDPLKAFGFQLRTDANEEDHLGMLKALRDGLRTDRTVRVEYIRTGLRTGRVIRVLNVR